MPIGRPFAKGNKMAKGGARPGAGRKTDAFKAKAANILDRAKGLEYLGRLLKGEEFVTKEITPKGHTTPIVVKEFPEHTHRVMAFRELKETAHGKARQEIDLTGQVDMNVVALTQIVKAARAARGLRT